MTTVERTTAPIPPADSVSNTKQAATFATLGLPFAAPGVCIRYDREHPKDPKTGRGGVAHFHFVSDEKNALRRFVRVYDAGTADRELETFLDRAKTDPALEAFVAALEPVLTDALIVWGRRFVENYRRLVDFLIDGAPELAVTGGEPAYDQKGRLIGKQGFSVHYVPRKKGAA